jgi:23S rRNA (cytosine1962-C5)-methyltransferase
VSSPFSLGGEVRLKPGREASVLRRHPWIWRGAVAGEVPAGERPLLVRSARGATLGVALPGGSGGSLALRMLAFGDEPWCAETLLDRLRAALALRRRLALDADGYRLVHAEGDGLPGLVIDRYAEHVVVQPFEPGWRPYIPCVVEALAELEGVTTVLERRGDTRHEPPTVVMGELPQREITFREGRARFVVDLLTGQKTGFFLDQRENRRRLADLAKGATVLNLFSYSGGFAVVALLCGATHVVNVDASAGALQQARATYALNSLAEARDSFVQGDAFAVSRQLVAAGSRFDVVVVDPPAFIKRKADLSRGVSGYRDINLQALRLVAPGGWLLTCSCSTLLSEELLGQALQAAAVDANRVVRVLERRGAGADHPVALACPEARHLKAWLCAVD